MRALRSTAPLLALALVLGALPILAGDSEVPTDFLTIQEAIDDPGTGPGDTITLLASGSPHYESSIHVTKAGITIAGEGMTDSEVVHSGIGFYIDADDVTLRDIGIRGGSQAIRFYIRNGQVDGTTLQRVRMSDESSRGIECHNDTIVSNLLLEECLLEDVAYGLRVASSGHIDGARFLDTTFRDMRIGIYEACDGGTSTMDNVEIRGCTFSNLSWYGLFFEEIRHAVIEENLFTDNYRDVQIFKWYQASVKVEDVVIRNNTMLGTSNAVFAIFNAHHISGQTEFDGIWFENNLAETYDSRGVYAGGHSTWQNWNPSEGGTGWDTVHIACNDFLGIISPGNGVYYYVPIDYPTMDALGGEILDVTNNWWGTDDPAAVADLMSIPEITVYEPFLLSPAGAGGPVASASVLVKKEHINTNARQLVPIAVLGSACFDAGTVDPYSVTARHATAIQTRTEQEDVNGDGLTDWVFYFRAREFDKPTQQECEEDPSSITVMGSTLYGEVFLGSYNVNYEGPDCP